MKTVLTGGAGYVGSVTTERLLAAGHDVLVVDSLRNGHQNAIPEGARFEQIDLLDRSALGEMLKRESPDAVLHFAALAVVPDSVRDPLRYFQVNTAGSINLLEAMRSADVQCFVFSSTAAVYGEPERVPVLESDPLRPINPYGQSKLMVEQILEQSAAAYGLRYAAFRYFNVAGASPTRGEYHLPETHVIPIALEVAAGEREVFNVFGTDYDTPDGSAIRDYVHVLDLADAHCLALNHLDQSLGPVNLATRDGFSVLQIVEAVKDVTGRAVPVKIAPRRPGDPPMLIADSRRARDLLGWKPARSTLPEIINSAWQWKLNHPNGY